MPRLQKAEGFILKKKLLLEKDYMVTLFTKELGKITALAKGARKITSRRSAHLQTGNLVSVQFSESHDVYYIQSSELISGFMKIRTQQKFEMLYLFLYILDKFLPERQEESELYVITKRFFIKLSADDQKPEDIFYNALYKTLSALGYIEEKLSLHDLLTEVENTIGEKLPRHVII